MTQQLHRHDAPNLDGDAVAGGMERRVRDFDWPLTPLGPRDRWPTSLRTAVDICLRSRHPVDILWGPDFIQIYNDAYRPILGAKHRSALGQPARECWAEIWPVVGPLLEEVLATGRACWFEDLPLAMQRNGFDEETYFTFSYGPVLDDSGAVGGIFAEVTETTASVIGRRRQAMLHHLAMCAADVHTTEDVCDSIAAVLRAGALDVPFAALYLAGDSGAMGRCFVEGALDELPGELDVTAPDASPLAHAAAAALGQRRTIVLDDLPIGGGGATHRAVMLPVHLPAGERAGGALLLGVSRRRALDAEYLGFLEIVGSHVAAALSRARAYVEERRRIATEAALEASERTEALLRRQALVFDTLSEAVAFFDAEGRVTGWNPAMETLTGYTSEEVMGQQPRMVQTPEMRATLTDDVLAAVRRDGAWSSEIPFVRKDGEHRLAEVKTVAEHDAEGRFCGMVAISRDITDRRWAEEALRRKNGQLEAIVQLQHEVATTPLDLEAVMRRIVESAAQMTEAAGALIGVVQDDEIVFATVQGIYELHAGTRLPLAGSLAGEALRTGLVVKADDTWADPRVFRGVTDWGIRSVVVVPLIYNQERIGVLAIGAAEPAVFTDHDVQALTLAAGLLAAEMAHAMAFEAKQRLVAERTAALAALEQSEERLRALSECSPDGIFAADIAGRCTYVNRRMAELVGATAESFLGEGWAQHLHPDDRDRFVREWLAATAAGEALSSQLRFRDARRRTIIIKVRSAPLVLGDGLVIGFVGTCQDVTERTRAEEALRHAEQQYRELVESVDAIVWRAAGDPPRMTFVSHQVELLLGVRPDQLIGEPVDWAGCIHPDDEEPVRLHVAAARRPHIAVQHDFRVRASDGREVWLRSLMRRIGSGPEPAEIIGVTFDVTELRQVREELARSGQQLRELASELQTIREKERTRIAREIHDELGQALTGLKMEVSWLRTRLPKRMRQLIESTDQMVGQIDGTIETVRRIASELRPHVLDSLGLVAALEWQVREFERRAQIRCTLSVTDAPIDPDLERSTALFRIVQEALTNVARHGNATEVAVKVEVEGDQIAVSVSDDGRGIPAWVASGTRSLGILGMRERALACGGDLSITSAPGTGTVVNVRMPLGRAAGQTRSDAES